MENPFRVELNFAGIDFVVEGKYKKSRQPARLRFNNYDLRLTDIGEEGELKIEKVYVDNTQITVDKEDFVSCFEEQIWEKILYSN